MNSLRQLLYNHEPLLYESLEYSWKIVDEEIFPSLSSPDESLNNSPHAINLENYLVSFSTPY